MVFHILIFWEVGNLVRRTDQERLAEIQQEMERKEEEFKRKQAQLDARRKQIEARVKDKERRERTHRLITVAGVFEHYWGYLDVDTADYLAKDLKEQAKKTLSLREKGQD